MIVQTGIENFISSPPDWSKNNRFGLLANPASVDRNFCHAKTLINNRFPGQLTTLFSPQHGFFADKQDNMIESDHIRDKKLNIPVFSLYGETRKPDREMLENIDILLIDIQDVGTRVYTFIYTMSYCMEAAAKYGKKIVVLDRPNPIGGVQTEGNILLNDFSSFVGRYPIPMRHGLTIGEMALLFNNHFNIQCDLEIIPMKGWNRKMYYMDTGLPWVPPSPNLPTPASAIVYPGQVVYEGTNISEGRGTTQPFELLGAPYINIEKVLKHLDPSVLAGIHLRPVAFEPTSNKWKEVTCYGFQIHITRINQYNSYTTALSLLQAFIRTSKGSFKWKQPPYEYEYEKLPIDLILGASNIREKIERLDKISDIEESWQTDLELFNRLKQEYHLYQ